MIKHIFLVLISFAIANAANNISQKAFNVINEANNLVEKNDLNKAKKLIEPLLDTNNDYEKSYLLQTLSNIYLLQNNYDKTIEIYTQIIKLNQFEKEAMDRFKASLSRLYLSTNKYQKSFELASSLVDSEFVKKDEIYETIIYSSYYLKEYKNTIKYSNQFLNQPNSNKSESIYKILYSSYVELKDLKGAIAIMDIMVKKWDKNEDYWMQLASLYEQTNDIDKAISTLEVAYKANMLSNKNNVLYFVNLLLQKQLYSKSATVFETYFANNILEKDEKNFEIYISSLINSKEYDKAIKKIKSSSFVNNDKINILLANLYYIKEEYKESVKTLEKNIEYSQKVEAQKHLLLGINYYELNDKTKSLYHLKKATQFTYTKTKASSIIKELKLAS